LVLIYKKNFMAPFLMSILDRNCTLDETSFATYSAPWESEK
jgi:hypothetical protein